MHQVGGALIGEARMGLGSQSVVLGGRIHPTKESEGMRDPGQHLAAPVPLPQGELVLGQRFLEGIGSERQVSPSDSGVLDPPPTGPEEREGQQQQNQERGTDHDSREGRGESGGWLIPRRLRGEPPGASVIGVSNTV